MYFILQVLKWRDRENKITFDQKHKSFKINVSIVNRYF